jgi:hypothetical protein
VREFDGDISLLPAPAFESPWSAAPKNYVRNVEAVGSNPITSTINLVGSPRESRFCWTFAPVGRVIHRV